MFKTEPYFKEVVTPKMYEYVIREMFGLKDIEVKGVAEDPKTGAKFLWFKRKQTWQS